MDEMIRAELQQDIVLAGARANEIVYRPNRYSDPSVLHQPVTNGLEALPVIECGFDLGQSAQI